MKKNRILIKIVSIIIAVAAAVTLIIVFKDEITEFFYEIHDKICAKKADRIIAKETDGPPAEESDEFADYADV